MKKICIKCDSVKEESLFVKNMNICKSCRAEYSKAYRYKNKEKLDIYQKEYVLRNKEKLSTYIEEYVSTNKKKLLDYQKEYRITHKEELSKKRKSHYILHREDALKYKSIWKKANPDKMKACKKNWISRNPHKITSYTNKRRASKIDATVSWGNQFYIEEIYDLALKRTEAIGIKYQVDHIVPLRAKLVCGLHWEGNLRVISASENLVKGNRYWPDMPDREGN